MVAQRLVECAGRTRTYLIVCRFHQLSWTSPVRDSVFRLYAFVSKTCTATSGRSLGMTHTLNSSYFWSRASTTSHSGRPYVAMCTVANFTSTATSGASKSSLYCLDVFCIGSGCTPSYTDMIRLAGMQ